MNDVMKMFLDNGYTITDSTKFAKEAAELDVDGLRRLAERLTSLEKSMHNDFNIVAFTKNMNAQMTKISQIVASSLISTTDLEAVNDFNTTFNELSSVFADVKNFIKAEEVMNSKKEHMYDAMREIVALDQNKDMDPMEKTEQTFRWLAIRKDRESAYNEAANLYNEQKVKFDVLMQNFDLNIYKQRITYLLNEIANKLEKLGLSAEVFAQVSTVIGDVKNSVALVGEESIANKKEYAKLLEYYGLSSSNKDMVLEPTITTPEPTVKPVEPVAAPEPTTTPKEINQISNPENPTNSSSADEANNDLLADEKMEQLLSDIVEFNMDNQDVDFRVEEIPVFGKEPEKQLIVKGDINNLIIPEGYGYQEGVGITNGEVTLPVNIERQRDNSDPGEPELPDNPPELPPQPAPNNENPNISGKRKVTSIKKGILAPHALSALAFAGITFVAELVLPVSLTLAPVLVGAGLGIAAQALYRTIVREGNKTIPAFEDSKRYGNNPEDASLPVVGFATASYKIINSKAAKALINLYQEVRQNALAKKAAKKAQKEAAMTEPPRSQAEFENDIKDSVREAMAETEDDNLEIDGQQFVDVPIAPEVPEDAPVYEPTPEQVDPLMQPPVAGVPPIAAEQYDFDDIMREFGGSGR